MLFSLLRAPDRTAPDTAPHSAAAGADDTASDTRRGRRRAPLVDDPKLRPFLDVFMTGFPPHR